MPQISDNGKNKELKIALHIYTTIGRKKAFDKKYYFGDKKTGKQIEALANRSKTNTEEVAKNRKIVCISISNLYKDIKRKQILRTNLEQLNQLEKEGLVIGDKKSRDGSKKLKKYMKKYRDGQEQATTK